MEIVSEAEEQGGRKRSYTVKISAQEIAETLAEARERAAKGSTRVASAVRMPGFRPGKIPANLVRKMHGAIKPDSLNEAVREGVQALLADMEAQPDRRLPTEGGNDRVRDVEIRLALEVLPEVPMPQIEGLALTRLKVEVTEADVTAEIERLVQQGETAHPKIRGGGGRQRHASRLDERSESYDRPIRETGLGDEASGTLGATEDDARLRKLARENIERELATLSREFLKRQLLDRLDDANRFLVPSSMIEVEFSEIWGQLQQEAASEEDPDGALAELERDRDEYHAIAERRVRLGLLLSEIGSQNGIEVTAQEMEHLISEAAQGNVSKDRKWFVDYARSNFTAAARLRAPLFEDKVVDFLLNTATIIDCVVKRNDLEQAVEVGKFAIAALDEQALAPPTSTTGEAVELAPTTSQEDGQALSFEERQRFLSKAAESGPSPATHRPELERQARQAAYEFLGSSAVLGRAIDSDEDLAEAINVGFPSEVIASLRDAGWSPGVLASVIAPKRTLMRRKSSGQRLSPAESDAAWRLAYILGLASSVLNGRNTAIAWLSRPKSALHRHLPHELLRSSVGTALIASLLRRLDEGDLA